MQNHRHMVIPLPSDLEGISTRFRLAGRQLFLVGGSVRDALLGQEPKDYDVATDATPDQIIELLQPFPEYRILEIGKSFGVIKVVTPEKNEYEIATFRSDIGKGRRPDAVEFTSIENDVQRRDLTINALFYNIESQEVVDYVGGIQDLEQRVVRTVGNPVERFDEDRLRILRALRFCARLDSVLDVGTDRAIKADNQLTGVSGERIRDEFLKGIHSARQPTRFLEMIEEYNLWSQVFPGLRVNTNYVNTRNIPVQLALLLRENEPRSLAVQLNKLKYSAVEVSQVTFLVTLQSLAVGNAFKLRKLSRHSHLSENDMLEFAKSSGAPELRLLEAFITYELSVTGEELQQLGLQGKELGAEQERRETANFVKLL